MLERVKRAKVELKASISRFLEDDVDVTAALAVPFAPPDDSDDEDGGGGGGGGGGGSGAAGDGGMSVGTVWWCLYWTYRPCSVECFRFLVATSHCVLVRSSLFRRCIPLHVSRCSCDDVGREVSSPHRTLCSSGGPRWPCSGRRCW